MINIKQDNEFNKEKKIKLELPFITKRENDYFLYFTDQKEGCIRCMNLLNSHIYSAKYLDIQDVLKSMSSYEKMYDKEKCE